MPSISNEDLETRQRCSMTSSSLELNTQSSKERESTKTRFTFHHCSSVGEILDPEDELRTSLRKHLRESIHRMSIEHECSFGQSFGHSIEEMEYSSLSLISKPKQSNLFSALTSLSLCELHSGHLLLLVVPPRKESSFARRRNLEDFLGKTTYEMIRLIDLLLVVFGNDIQITLMFTWRQFQHDLFISGWRKNCFVFFSIDNDLNLIHRCQSFSLSLSVGGRR